MIREVGREVRRLVGLILKRPIEDAEDVRREQEPSWDSLKHVEIMFAIEDRFSIKFTGEEFAALASVDEIAAAVEARVVA